MFEDRTTCSNFSKLVSIDKLISNDYDLTVDLYVKPQNMQEIIDIQGISIKIEKITTRLKELSTEVSSKIAKMDRNSKDAISVGWRPLSELLERSKGVDISKDEMIANPENSNVVKVISNNNASFYLREPVSSLVSVNYAPAIIVKAQGRIGFEYCEEPFVHNKDIWSYNASNNKTVNIKYVYYFLKKEEKFFQNLGDKSVIPRISIETTNKFLIPIPYPDDLEMSLKYQQNIVDILDLFTELSSQLSAEILERQKQYEFYQNLLLTFPVK